MRFLISAALFMTLMSLQAFADLKKQTLEQEAILLGKHFKPIADDEWKAIAGTKITEKYSIIQGDTLTEVSKRLFGDSKYWPKIWAINNATITNPHRIYPKTQITFSPGTGNSLPSVTITSEITSSSSIDSMVVSKSGTQMSPSASGSRSGEWKDLPKQRWEFFHLPENPDIDPLGFDKNTKIIVGQPTGFDPEAIPASNKITLLGQIVGSRSEGQYLTLNDTVYIHADETLQVGETYGITKEPNLLKSRKSDRIGYSYLFLGKVKILGVRDNLFVGRIVSVHDFVARGSSLIPLPKRIPVLTPIPGPKSVQGVMMVDHSFSTYTSAQFKQVFIDKGSDDGVQPGMVFRVYEHYDPSNDKKITNSDFIIDADLIIIQVTEIISSAIIIQSISPVAEGATAILLTDVSDLQKNLGFRPKGDEKESGKDELDELDKLDSQDTLGKEERKELKQLEHWKSNPDSPTPEVVPTTPLQDTTPPPPGPSSKPVTPPEPLPPTEAPPPSATTEAVPPPLTSEAAPPAPPFPEGAEPPAPLPPTESISPVPGGEAPPPPPTDEVLPP